MIKRKVVLLMILTLMAGLILPSEVKAQEDIRVRIEYVDVFEGKQLASATYTTVNSGEVTLLYPIEIEGYTPITKAAEVNFTNT